jgi:hypothetical protein
MNPILMAAAGITTTHTSSIAVPMSETILYMPFSGTNGSTAFTEEMGGTVAVRKNLVVLHHISLLLNQNLVVLVATFQVLV